MPNHDIGFRIFGHDIQMVEISLDPGETVVAEAGAMTYMEEDIDFETRMGDGSEGVMGKLLGIGKRMLTGESFFLTHFTNDGEGPRHVAFSAPYPGSIVPLNLKEFGGEVICQKDAFLAAAKGTHIEICLQKRLGTGFFGGEGFIMQRLRGGGMVFLHGGGAIVRKTLQEETLRIDTGCLVAFTGDIDYSIKLAGGLRSMLFGGEGLFLVTLRGTGLVWVQSMPFSRFAERMAEQSLFAGRDEG